MKTDNEALSALLYEKEIENPETTIRFEDLKNYTLGKGE
jgi:hypothetical protein